MDTAKRVAGLAGVAMCLVGSFGNRADAQTVAQFKRQSDVIYGRKFGVALTMEVLERMREHELGHEQSKVGLTEDYFDLYPDRIKVLERLFALEHKPADLEAAFQR